MSVVSQIVILMIVGGGLVTAMIWGTCLPSPFRERNCQGKDWRRAFPEVPKNDIRDFLLLFVSAFAFKDADTLKFNPDDKILDIYKAIYPNRWMPDSMEVETLDKDIEMKYQVTLAPVWDEKLTLGELFSYVRAGVPK